MLERVLERVGQRPDARLLAVTVTAVRRSFATGIARAIAGPALAGCGFTGGRRVGRADDVAVGARGAVERVQVAVLDPHEPREQIVEHADVIAPSVRPQITSRAPRTARSTMP